MIDNSTPEKKYRIQDNGTYFTTGTTKDNRQVVIGFLAPEIVVYFFDPEGRFLNRDVWPLSVPPSRDERTGIYLIDDEFHRALSGELEQVKDELGFQSSTIEVRFFFDEEHSVGITERPADYQAFLDGQEEYDESEAAEYREIISEWDGNGDFVFCWAEEYWLDKDGEVHSS